MEVNISKEELKILYDIKDILREYAGVDSYEGYASRYKIVEPGINLIEKIIKDNFYTGVV